MASPSRASVLPPVKWETHTESLPMFWSGAEPFNQTRFLVKVPDCEEHARWRWWSLERDFVVSGGETTDLQLRSSLGVLPCPADQRRGPLTM